MVVGLPGVGPEVWAEAARADAAAREVETAMVEETARAGAGMEMEAAVGTDVAAAAAMPVAARAPAAKAEARVVQARSGSR